MNNNQKIYILENLKDEPWGGGNQFLKNLKREFEKLNVYVDQAENASHIIFNSYQNLKPALNLKRKFPEKFFVHRLGPIFHYHRGSKWKKIDQVTLLITKQIADLAIFQSAWSYQESCKLGFKKSYHAIIGNAVDSAIFNKNGKTLFNPDKIKLIATSWSANPNKGFDIYQYLDANLDFSKYTMTFIGNTPVKFKNIRHIMPVKSSELAKELKQHDIYLGPFKYEAGSNAILEALACGLPVVALDSGSNSEEVKKGGELFQDKNNLIDKIKLVSQNYNKYQTAIQYDTAQEVAEKYLKAISQIRLTKKPKPTFWLTSYINWKLKKI